MTSPFAAFTPITPEGVTLTESPLSIYAGEVMLLFKMEVALKYPDKSQEDRDQLLSTPLIKAVRAFMLGVAGHKVEDQEIKEKAMTTASQTLIEELSPHTGYTIAKCHAEALILDVAFNYRQKIVESREEETA